MYWKRGVIYAAIQDNGIKQVFSTGTDDPKQALAIRDAKKADMVKGDFVSVTKGVRMAELFDDYIANLKANEADSGEYMTREYETTSYRMQKRIEKHLLPHFGDLKPSDLTTEVLRSYKSKRIGSRPSIATINSEFRALRAALKLGAKKRPRKVNPNDIPDFSAEGFINDKAEKKLERTGIITQEQKQQILGQLADHLKPVFLTTYWLGIRAKELKFARRSNLNFKEHNFKLESTETKGGDLRVCPMNTELEAVILAWDKQTRTSYPSCKWLFHFNGEQIGSFATAWNAALRRCGLRVPVLNPDGSQKIRISKTGKRRKVWKNLVKFHDARRSAETNDDINKVEERDRMKVRGHKTVSQSRKYNQSQEAAERVREKQNAMLAGVTVEEPKPIAPVASVSDWKASLKELKETFDQGLIPEDLYRAEVSKVMASRVA